uniref:Chloride channel protein n=1 Tax=mine drainage metagenome TaxID=410659 RepID=E6PTY3_9ZZZZ
MTLTSIAPPANPARRRALVRLVRSRGRRLFLQYGLPWGAALLVGLVGLVAVPDAQWSTSAYGVFIGWIAGRAWLAFLLITPAFTMLAVFLTRRYFQGSEGSGIPQVIAALHAPRDATLMNRLFGLRVIVGKLVVSLLGFFGGMTIGRESPTVHLGAAIMAETRRFYPHAGPKLERQLLLAGAAAGLSGAFNTPLAGIIFAIEEIARNFENRTNGTMITAVVFSGLTSLALAGNYLYFGQMSVPQNFGIAFVLPVLATALLCGVLGAAFNWALLHWEVWMPNRCSSGARTNPRSTPWSSAWPSQRRAWRPVAKPGAAATTRRAPCSPPASRHCSRHRCTRRWRRRTTTRNRSRRLRGKTRLAHPHQARVPRKNQTPDPRAAQPGADKSAARC